MHKETVTTLLNQYPIISEQIKRPALHVVLGQLETVLAAGIEGDVVEFGCYIGTTSLFMRRLMDGYSQSDSRQLHVYDSFAGLPAKGPQDSSPAGVDFQAGELTVTKKQFIEQFQRANLQLPVIHKGWFDQLPAGAVPEHIAFAFLDGDFYSSIIDSLRLVWPQLQPGGVITIDDYKRETLPGVEQAVRDFLQGKTYRSLTYSHNIAVLKR